MAFLPNSPLPRHPTRAAPIPQSTSVQCCLPQHLPQSAYTTLPPSDTPLCRLIAPFPPSYPRADPPYTLPALTHALHTALDAGFSTFHLPTPHMGSYVVPNWSDVCSVTRQISRSARLRAQFCGRLVLDPREVDGGVRRRVVEGYLDGVLRELGVERMHLVQLQWPDYSDRRYLDVLGYLGELCESGKVGSVGTVYFPTRVLREVEGQGLRIACNQVGLSILDRRAMVEMVRWCGGHGIRVLGSGTGVGGLMSERYLGMPEPRVRGVGGELEGFAKVVGVWGGWGLFQELLYAIKGVADKHGVSMENVAMRWVLEREGVSAVLAGGGGWHRGVAEWVRAFGWRLDEEDRGVLDEVVRKGNDVYRIWGDCGEELKSG